MRKTCKEIIFKSGMSEIPTGKNILHKAATWSNSTKKKKSFYAKPCSELTY